MKEFVKETLCKAELTSLLTQLAVERNNIARLLCDSIDIKKKIETVLETVPELTDLNIELIRNKFELDLSGQERANLEGRVRLVGKDLASDFPNSEAPVGITVKQFDTLEITDSQALKLWAVYNLPSAVSVDERAALKAIANLEVPFAKVVKEPRVSISSDLTAYLPKPEETGEGSQDTPALIAP